MPTYAELRLRIDRGVARGSYRIVATGPAGEALGRFKLPLSDIELENFILKIGSTRRGKRRIDSPEMELAKTFGTKLFGALFEGDVRELYRSSVTETRAEGRGLRVTLSLTGAPELLQVPWEYMYDHPSFLSISTWTPIVRYLDLPKPRRPLQIDLPLRILGLVSAPSDFEAIDAEQERAKLETALAPLIGVGAIAIDWLEEASLRALQRQLRKADYHVFHYIGHGGYDDAADDGVLLFEDEQGRGRRVSGVQLGTILADEVSLRLAVLNSCEGGRSSIQDPFSGVATSLIEREIPAVIGMQFEITDRAAIVFGGEFYSALADGLAVDSAVAEARKAIYADQNDIEWGTPVLFMRVADGRLFDVKAHAPIRVADGEAARQKAAEEADVVAAAAVEAAERERAEAAERERAAEAERVEQARVQREAEAAAVAEAERREHERVEHEAAEAEAERVEDERVQREAETARAAAAEAERLDAERIEQERLKRGADEVAERERMGAAAAALVLGSQAAEASEAAGPARVQSSSQTATLSRIPEYQRRATGRAAVGGVLTMVVAWVVTYFERGGYDVGPFVWEFVGAAVFMAVAFAVAVALAERYVPAVRVPEGALYRFVGGNPLAAAGIEGVLVGSTLGFGILRLFYPDEVKPDLSAVLVTAVVGAIWFVVAEAAIARIWRRPAGVALTSTAPDTASSSDATRPTQVGLPTGLARPAGRAALGGLLGLAATWLWVFFAIPGAFESESFEFYWNIFVEESIWTVVLMLAAVTVAESVWPAVRVPDGSLYRPVGGNHWAAAAIQGAIAGATLGFIATNAYGLIVHSSDRDLHLGTVVLHGAFTALGFVVAELILVRLIRPRRDPAPST